MVINYQQMIILLSCSFSVNCTQADNKAALHCLWPFITESNKRAAHSRRTPDRFPSCLCLQTHTLMSWATFSVRFKCVQWFSSLALHRSVTLTQRSNQVSMARSFKARWQQLFSASSSRRSIVTGAGGSAVWFLGTFSGWEYFSEERKEYRLLTNLVHARSYLWIYPETSFYPMLTFFFKATPSKNETFEQN